MFWNRRYRPLLVVVPHSGAEKPYFLRQEEDKHGIVTYLFFPHDVWLQDRRVCREYARQIARRYQRFSVVLMHHKLGQRRFDRALVRFVCMLRKQGAQLASTKIMVPERPYTGPVSWLSATRTGRRLCRTFAEHNARRSFNLGELLKRQFAAMSVMAARLF